MGRLIASMIVIAALTGCSSATVQQESLESGDSRAFNADYQKVAPAAVAAIKAMKLDVTQTSDEPSQVVIMFVRPTSGSQWGGAGRLVVQKVSTPPTPVTINYEKRFFSFAAGQGGYARAIFKKMDEALSGAQADSR